ncbi:MAG: hypothetical protein U5L09_03665 [Bacteroidales bacterium]|nr:hypothetical protein [Bacteroidales bacterium]
MMYPDFANDHIAALSRHDYERIKQHHFSEKQIHYLPNPVSMDEVRSKLPARENRAMPYITTLNWMPKATYPVSVYLRKNIGVYSPAHLFADLANSVNEPASKPR